MRYIGLLCLLLLSCSKKQEAKIEQKIAIGMEVEPKSLDPRKVRDLDSTIVVKLLFEGLMRSGKDGAIEMGIAKEFSVSEDGLTYTFLLRDSKWSDGTAVTADDFVFAWTSILDPQFATDVAYHLFPIKNARKVHSHECNVTELGIKSMDTQTLIVELESPTPYFLQLLTMPAYFPVPKKSLPKNGLWGLEARCFVSNGPFQLEYWKHSDELGLQKNPNYWEEKNVSLERISLHITNAETALRMFIEGDLDWIGSPLSRIPVEAMDDLFTRKKLESQPFLATQFCRINTSTKIRGKENPLASKEMRKQLASVLDRSVIVEHVLRGGQKESKCLVPSFMGLCTEEARGEIVPGLFPQINHPLVISYYTNERNAQIAMCLKKQWEEALQISVQLEPVEPKLYFQKIAKKDYQIALGSWVADFHDPINFLEVFQYGENGTNNTGWENAEYIDLLKRSQISRDSESRKAILRQAESILMDEMPIIPLYEFVMNYVKRDGLEGAYLSSEGHLDLRSARKVN